ncbi:MAG TPA: hypothetical protein DCZ95_15175 [Verrucomicrobia bacterium]|nr:MAG: hypothetical protein A2X46_18930 [Lentisphaerae bacterium GWF2_57_35]HBA85427.1 hypothetical protein [Verrucomicrobiota bacterium]
MRNRETLGVKFLHRLALLGAGMVFLASCAYSPPSEKAAESDRRHTNWWNFYRRGLEAFDRRDYAQARDDFEKCLGLKSGARTTWAKDSWKERTYGLHTLENYFPHRELGVCYYYLGDMESAKAQLESSLQQEPSGRARHYFNRVNAARLSLVNPPGPSLNLSDSSTPVWTRERMRVLAGRADGAGYIANITVNGQRLYRELAEPHATFSAPIRLQEGVNDIPVTAEDLLGRKNRQSAHWIADWKPPQVVIRKQDRKGATLELSGICYDNGELLRVALNRELVLDAAPTSDVREVSFSLSVAQGEQVLLHAEDRAGNRLDYWIKSDDFSTSAMQPPGILLAAEGAPPGILAGAKPSAGTDALRPVLRIAGAGQTLSILGDEYYLDGEALDPGGLADIQVQGQSWMRPEDQGAIIRRFAGHLPVSGTQTIHIVAIDLAGNRAEAAIDIRQKQPEYLDEIWRLRAVFMPSQTKEDLTWVKPEQVDEILLLRALEPPVRFRLLARGNELKRILQEQEISLSDLSDVKAALEIGKLAPAEYVLASSLFRNGDGLTIYLRAIDTEQRQVLCSMDVYSEAKLEDLRYQLDGLVMKLEQFFPVTEAHITAADHQRATLSAGAREGIRKGSRFLIVNDGGKVAREGEQPIELRVESAQRDSSRARIRPAQAYRQVTVDNRVYAR